MSRLQLRLNLYGDDAVGTSSVMANIYPADERARQALPRGRRNVAIPAGDDYGSYQRVELPHGRYLVEASLPSGDLATSEVELTAGGPEDVAVELEAGGSPHEWLAWQHFVGNVADRDDLDRTGRGPKLESVAGLRVHWLVESRTAGDPGAIWSHLGALLESDAAPEQAVADLQAALPLARSDLDVPAANQDPLARVFRFRSRGAVDGGGQLVLPANPAVHEGSERCYVALHDDRAAHLVAAPVPWIDIHAFQETSFELAAIAGGAVTTVVRDPSLGSVLGYMTSGSLNEARQLVDRARDMLFYKISNPLGAAAGSYVMVATEHGGPDRAWHDWVGNLKNWFPWLPDGAIAHGRLKLEHQQKDSDVTEALDSLLEACRRGLPYFSIGVRWLLDGLTSFAEDDEFVARREEIEGWLAPVRRVAGRINFRQQFTTIQLARLGT